MFKYTKASLKIIVDDIKRIGRIFRYGSLIFTATYFIYALISKTGNFYANVILASLFVAYSIFEIATREKDMKATRKTVKKGYKWLKLFIRALTLVSMLYGIYTATTKITPMSIILATLMIILWVLQFFLALLVEVVESKINLVIAGFREDTKKPSIFGKKDDEEPKPKEIVILDEQIEKEKSEKQEQKRQKKALKRAKKDK